jgi:GMP synthase PP-ATPase subunit
LRAIDFATSNNMIIWSRYFPHKNLHKETWRSPGVITKNQIDHVMIDGRYASSITDVRSCRGADCDTHHFLVHIKYRQLKNIDREYRIIGGYLG